MLLPELVWPEPPAPEVAQGPIPSFTVAELDEFLKLTHPLRVERDGRWHVVPTDLESLRAARREFLWHLEQVQREQFKTTAAYQRHAIQAIMEMREQREEKLAQKMREERRDALMDKRAHELISVGLNPFESAKIAAKEFSE